MVATVDSAGTVVARGGGGTAIVVTIGGKAARAHVYVRQRPAGLQVVGDTLFRVPEGGRGKTTAQVVDGRGTIPSFASRWRSADPSIAAVDSLGNLTAIAPGRTLLTATAETMLAQLAVEVYPVASSLTLLSGDGQRAPAGRRVPQAVTVQVVSAADGRLPECRFASFWMRAPAVPSLRLTRRRPGNRPGRVDARRVSGPAGALGGRGGYPTPTVVTAEAEPVAANTRITVVSEGLQGPASETLQEPAAVRVTDTSGVAMVDVPVAWSVADDGSVLATESRTDSLGEARARWTLGPKSGAQRAYVQVGSPRTVPRFAVTATALAGPAAKASVVGNAKLEGVVGQSLRRRWRSGCWIERATKYRRHLSCSSQPVAA